VETEEGGYDEGGTALKERGGSLLDEGRGEIPALGDQRLVEEGNVTRAGVLEKKGGLFVVKREGSSLQPGGQYLFLNRVRFEKNFLGAKESRNLSSEKTQHLCK